MAILKVKTQVKASLREQVGEQKYHDDEAVQDVLRHILREDKAPRELIGGFAVNPFLAAEQFTMIAQAYGKDFGVRLRHMILSFSPDESPSLNDAKNIAYQVAAYYGNDYQIVWACHTDAHCLNIHFVMNMVSYRNGMKYDGSKADFYRFQHHVNYILDPYGMHIEICKDTPD